MFKGEPIQLVRAYDDDGSLVLNDDAVEIIKEINGPLGIVIVIGPYRTGKSFIMSRMMGCSKGFTLGDTYESCTKGIWMWSKPLKKIVNGRETSILVMDTEGLQSPDSNEQWDQKIFILSYLISSVFMYNNKEAINREAIKALATVTCFADKIEKIKQEDKPNLIWVLRDCFLKLNKSENDYLMDSLKLEPVAGLNKNVNERNMIKEAIMNSFSSHDLHMLPIPVNETEGLSIEEALQNLDSMDWSILKPSFTTKMDSLCEFAKNILKPKNVENVELNGSLFAEYLKRIIRQINSSEIISITNNLTQSMEFIAKNSLSNAISSYRKQFNDFIKRNPYPIMWSTFSIQHILIERSCLASFKSEISFLPKSKLQHYLQEFKDYLYNKDFICSDLETLESGLLYHYFVENRSEIRKNNMKILKHLWKKYITPYLNYDDCFSDIYQFRSVKDNNVIKKYKIEAMGSENDINEVLDEFLQINSTYEIEKRIANWNKLKEEKEQETRRLNEERESLRKRKEELERIEREAERERQKEIEERRALAKKRERELAKLKADRDRERRQREEEEERQRRLRAERQNNSVRVTPNPDPLRQIFQPISNVLDPVFRPIAEPVARALDPVFRPIAEPIARVLDPITSSVASSVAQAFGGSTARPASNDPCKVQ